MRVHTQFLYVACGILFGIAFVFQFLWWCFMPAFAIFLFAISKETSKRRLFFYGSLVGALEYGGAFYWVWSIYPILWLPNQGMFVQLGLIFTYWILTSIAMGIVVGLFALCARPLLKGGRASLLLIPLLWLLSEVVRSVIFSIYSLGPGSTIDAAFSYGYLGYLLTEQKLLLQLGAFGGVYMLSFVAACIGTYAYLFFARKLYANRIATAVTFGALVLAVFIPPFVIHAPHAIGKKVIAIETYFDPQHSSEEKWEDIKDAQVEDAVGQALALKPDVIVLPEDTDMMKSFGSYDELYAWAQERSKGHGTVIVDNAPGIDRRGANVIRSHMYDTLHSQTYNFDKKYLVPQGEFLSYLHEGILSLFLPRQSVMEIRQFMRFKDGIEGDSSSYPSYLPGILACFEAMVPWGVRDALSVRHPGFVIHQVSHSWFNNAFSLEYELDSMLKVHAVWNNAPIISASNMADSKLYAPSGAVQEGMLIKKTRWWSIKEFDL